VLYDDDEVEQSVPESRIKLYKKKTPQYDPDSPNYNIPQSPAYDPNSPAYDPNSPAYNPNSPAYSPNSPAYSPKSPAYKPQSPVYSPETPDYYTRTNIDSGIVRVEPKYNFPDDLNYYYLNLSKEEKIDLERKSFEEKVAYLEKVKQQQNQGTVDIQINPNILDVQSESNDVKPESPTDSGEKKIIESSSASSSSSDISTSSGTRKITL